MRGSMTVAGLTSASRISWSAMWIGRWGFAPVAEPRYREGVSLRRLRYQLRCAATGHDTRPYLVGGSHVEQRCLRCGALVGAAEPPASEQGLRPDGVSANDLGPQPSELPPATAAPTPNGNPAASDGDAGEAEDTEDTDETDDAALAALAALRELGELHAAGVLTDKEFAAK